jgi:hypothetical protein
MVISVVRSVVLIYPFFHHEVHEGIFKLFFATDSHGLNTDVFNNSRKKTVSHLCQSVAERKNLRALRVLRGENALFL